MMLPFFWRGNCGPDETLIWPGEKWGLSEQYVFIVLIQHVRTVPTAERGGRVVYSVSVVNRLGPSKEFELAANSLWAHIITHDNVIMRPLIWLTANSRDELTLLACFEPSVSLEFTLWACCEITGWAHHAMVEVSSQCSHCERFRWAYFEYGFSSHLHWDGIHHMDFVFTD